MAKQDDTCFQVPVINKTEGLFGRDPNNTKVVLKEHSTEIKELFESEPHVFTAKTDGTCAMVCKIGSSYMLMRRQDIKVNGRNYDMVMASGHIETIAGNKCFVTKMDRGSHKDQKIVLLYIFQLDGNDKPEPEFGHIIGFTPLLHNFGDDKYAITAIKGTNGDTDMHLFTTVFDGTLDVAVKWIHVDDLMQSKLLMTVEIMGSKISNKYGFANDQHFINPHGSIIFSQDKTPPIDFDKLRVWLENDNSNRWANVEGYVVHFPKSNRRVKVHRGHLGLEQTWRAKKESGIKFIF